MSLFVCEECRCIENTGLSGFWLRNTRTGAGRALCSECDPMIGQWHGHFHKRPYDPETDSPDWIDGEWVEREERGDA